MYKSFFDPDNNKPWASVKVDKQCIDKYPLEWINPYLLRLAT